MLKAHFSVSFFVHTMGRKSDLSEPKRAQIIALRSQGFTERHISNALSVSKTATHQAIVRHAALGNFASKKRSGRPRVTTVQTDRLVRRVVVKDPTSSAVAIQSVLPPDALVSVRTIQRRLASEFNLRAYRPASKPMRSTKNVRDRLIFCNRYKTWTSEDWHKVMFSDETMVRQFYSLRSYVRRPPQTAPQQPLLCSHS